MPTRNRILTQFVQSLGQNSISRKRRRRDRSKVYMDKNEFLNFKVKQLISSHLSRERMSEYILRVR